MTRLLVSVRDAEEAATAVLAGADIIDVKEPLKGSLGAASRNAVEEILCVVDGRVPVSMARGELLQSDPRALADIPQGVKFAKVGLAGCGSQSDWILRWGKFVSLLPNDIAPVAVVYADQAAADAPAPQAIVDEAARLNCHAVLVDTWGKQAGSLLNHWSIQQLQDFVTDVESRRMWSVVAGGLSLPMLGEILATGPSIIAVRGAACQGDRTGKIVGKKVKQLRLALAEAAQITTA